MALTHAFVVPVFGEPRWLDRCLESIERQSITPRILITTSTPNRYVAAIATAHQVPLVVNPISAGIASDWNFALAQAEADWVSLAHQDDWYESDYLECCLKASERIANAILVFTDATEVLESDTPTADGHDVTNTRVKRIICRSTFLGRRSIESGLHKRLLLSFGNPIPCASAMVNRRALPAFSFPDGWKSNLDWRAWLALAREPGGFVYIPRRLVHRTLHADAATTRALDDREREDEQMFRELWPAPIAAVLNRVYARSRNAYSTLRDRG